MLLRASACVVLKCFVGFCVIYRVALCDLSLLCVIDVLVWFVCALVCDGVWCVCAFVCFLVCCLCGLFCCG